MKVSFSATTNTFKNKPFSQERPISFNSHLNADTVSFKGYDHLRLDGFDAVCASEFKLHMEKFKSKNEFDNWAKNELNTALDLSKYETVHKDYNNERMTILKEWSEYLKTDTSEVSINSHPTLSLLIFHSITKKLKADNKELPPILDKVVLHTTVNTLSERLEVNKNALFSFDKTYRNNLRMAMLDEMDEESTSDLKTGWVKVDSLQNDEKNFDDNVRKLQMLSSRAWCLKSGIYAQNYLLNGNFHIYFVDGKPKAGIRMIDNRIESIQGVLNNEYIPASYLSEIENYIKENAFDSSSVDKDIKQAKLAAFKIEKIKKDIAGFIKKNDTTAILKYFGISVKESKPKNMLTSLGFNRKDNDIKKTISHYCQPSDSYSFSDLGIDENELLKNVVKIEKDGEFLKSEATDLTALIEISGNANFGDCKDINIPNIKIIGGDANFVGLKRKNLSSLEKIGQSAYFTGAEDIDMHNLKTVGKDAWFDNTQNLDVSALESVEGKLWCTDAKNIKIKKDLFEKKSG